MRMSIWFDFVDNDDVPSLILDSEKHGDHVHGVVIPAIGETVGLRSMSINHPNVNAAYYLDKVVDVRHFIKTEDEQFSQEIHVLLSERR